MKFFLYLYLASYAGAEILGWLGLLTASTIMYSAVGDACVLQTIARDAVTVPFRQTLRRLRIYFRCLPFFFVAVTVCGLLLVGSGFEPVIILLSTILLFAEMINNNFFILLMNKHKPFAAQTLYVIRSGLWIPVFIGLTYVKPALLTLEFLLSLWAIFSLSVAILLIITMKLYSPPNGLKKSPDSLSFYWNWMVQKIRQSVSLLKLNFLMALNDCAASFILSVTLGVEKLGVYIYFQQVASAMMNIVRFGIIQPLWPDLIKNYSTGHKSPLELQKSHLIQIAGISIVGALTAYPVYQWTGVYLGHIEFQQYFSIFIPILILFVVSSIGCLQDAIFYSIKQERVLNKILVFQLPFNIAMICGMSFSAGLNGVVWGITITASLVVALKQTRLASCSPGTRIH